MCLARALLVALTLGILVAPLAADAQQSGKVPRIGYLSPGPPSAGAHLLQAFRIGLRELGYVEGQNIVIESRWAEGRSERLPDLAAELVRLKVDVIVTAGGSPAALAAKRATATIPIVMRSVGDPVDLGLVASLAQPGGNITGLSLMTPELSGKRLQLLKEVLPKVSRVAVLTNPANPSHAVLWRETEVAARVLRVQLQSLEIRGPNEFEAAFAAATRGRAGAVAVIPDPVTTNYRAKIVELAAKTRLPAIYGFREFVDNGGLMSYGPDLSDLSRRAATYVDKILRGAKPADLPVEQPTKFELAINLKTAKALGLTIPPSVLFRADQVIE